MENKTVNKCIYCGSTVNLTDEHVVPFGLEGVTQLKRASCLICNKITSPLETHVLGLYLGKIRAALKMRHRHKKRKRKTHYTIDVHQGDKSSKLTLPIGEQPGILIFPVFDEPTYITDHYNLEDRGPLNIVGTRISHVAGPSLGQFAEDLKNSGFTAFDETVDLQPPIFARFLAKVAYGFAVWHYGLECIEKNYIVPSIRGDDNRLGRWIGTVKEKDQQIHNKGIHLSLAGITTDGTIIVRLRLLALFDTPEYIVIIGKIKPECLEVELGYKT